MAATQRRPSRGTRPSRVLLPLCCGLVGLYVVALGLFTLLHYESGGRPPASRVMRDFHAFLGIGPSAAQAEPPPVAIVPPPPPRLVAPPPPVYEPSPLEKIAQTLRRVEREAPALKQRERDSGFEAARVEVLSELCDARDRLNEILDRQPSNDRANGLWDRLQQLLVAVRKL